MAALSQFRSMYGDLGATVKRDLAGKGDGEVEGIMGSSFETPQSLKSASADWVPELPSAVGGAWSSLLWASSPA